MPADTPGRRVATAVQLVALVGLAAYAVVILAGQAGGLVGDLFYNGLSIIAAGLCIGRAAVTRVDRQAWMFLGMGLSAWVFAELWTTLYVTDDYPAEAVSPGDMLVFAFYIATYVSLLLLVRSHAYRFEASLWLDGVIGALAIGAAVTAFLLSPILDHWKFGVARALAELAYPVGDLLLLALVMGVFAGSGWRPGRTWMFIGAGVVGLAAADILFLYLSALDSYQVGGPVFALWAASALALGVAAWQPAPGPEALQVDGHRLHVIPALFASTALLVLTYGELEEINGFSLALAIAALTGVIVRMSLSLALNLRLLRAASGQANTDALTGLHNRRKLVSDLEGELEAGSAQRMLLLFDLNGFKSYNDAFGHIAGDLLLARLASRLQKAVRQTGRAYRLGGDEFCALVAYNPARIEQVVSATTSALRMRGHDYGVDTACGRVLIPDEAADITTILQLADERMYSDKGASRSAPAPSAGRQFVFRGVIDDPPHGPPR